MRHCRGSSNKPYSVFMIYVKHVTRLEMEVDVISTIVDTLILFVSYDVKPHFRR